MKTRLLSLTLLLALTINTVAKNTTKSVEQVTEAITISDNWDYVITGTYPFAVTGSINITNTDHAVVILKNIRPSSALSYLTFITINGETAENDVNCQVKKYAQGSIIMPYAADIQPLTVYSEPNFQGDSCSDFGTENSGGYMNNLSTAKLNNNIRSFKLKRGYMVTFANGTSGYGYNRCFIADTEDLEYATMPDAMDKRISSYRLFVWYDAEKKGLANDTGEESTQALNVSWCYSFGLGENRGIDCECVPHHIYEDWPSSASCGKVTYSPHLKTNNEPGNSSDDTPQDVETVLNNWQNLMRTGMRLCSPSSHDGSLSWLWEFMDSIDAKGWRCDILDMHCYWATGTFNNLATYYNNYKRPIWISEFVWGASWNSNGIFGAVSDRSSFSTENQQKNYDGMQPILVKLNSWAYVERYAYWNSEAVCSKIYYNGELSILGEYYASMESGIGYSKSYEFVPTVVMHSPTDLAAEYTKKTRKLSLTWTNENMEFTDSTHLEMRINESEWETIQVYDCSERSSYTYIDTLAEDYQRGIYYFRVHNYDIDGTERLTSEVQVSLVGAEGDAGFQYGTLEVSSTENLTTDFDAVDGETPAVFTGLISYEDYNVVPVNTIYSVSTSSFVYRPLLWNQGDYSDTMSKTESTDFMVISIGSRQVGDITMEIAKSDSKITNDSTWISFANPFPEGVTPVVIVNVISRYNAYPLMAKVWGITNEGFAVKLARQEGVSSTTFSSQYIYYIAATPGQETMDDGKILTVGRSTEDRVDGRRSRPIAYVDTDGNEIGLFNPIMLVGPQTNNLDVASVYRFDYFTYDQSNTNYNGDAAAIKMRIIRQRDTTDESVTSSQDLNTVSGDYMGWIIISDPAEDPTTNINQTKQTSSQLKSTVRNGQIIVEGAENYTLYTVSGQQLPATAHLARGIYVVRAGSNSVKVLVP